MLIGIVVATFLYFSLNSFCANSTSCIKNLSGKYEPEGLTGEFMGKMVRIPDTIASNTIITPVLGQRNGGTKKIEIDLSKQKLYAYEGGTLIYEFLVSTGKWSPTPTGEFQIWIKLRHTRMTGGNRAWGTFYDLPNVPYTMYFYGDKIPKTMGYGIHGTYWHNNFGHPMSHGCVNMRTEDVEKLYNWADPPSQAFTTYASSDNPGTKVMIYGITPVE